jgi:hypothetical protein
MFIVMAVNAQKFPVAPVGRVIVMVVVPVVNREFLEPLAVKFPAAMAADPGEKFQGPFPVGVFPFLLGAQGLIKAYAAFFIPI